MSSFKLRTTQTLREILKISENPFPLIQAQMFTHVELKSPASQPHRKTRGQDPQDPHEPCLDLSVLHHVQHYLNILYPHAGSVLTGFKKLFPVARDIYYITIIPS